MTPNTIQFSGTDSTWVMRITADRRIEVNENVEVTKTAQDVLGALQHLLKPAPVQEPVAHAVFTVLEGFTLPHDVRKILEAAYYTLPAAQRQWVGLTEEERTEIRREHYARTLPLMDAVEAKLKEKNT